MITRMYKNIVGVTLIAVLAGCQTYVGVPQTREEFVSSTKQGGLFRNSETITVRKPVNDVVASVKILAEKCLNVTVKTPNTSTTGNTGSNTTYRPTMHPQSNGVSALTIQESYGARFTQGEPPGGMYTVAAEIRGAAGGLTQVDIYHITGRGMISDAIKSWVLDGNQTCPRFGNFISSVKQN